LSLIHKSYDYKVSRFCLVSQTTPENPDQEMVFRSV
jgi:hypothetical protein